MTQLNDLSFYHLCLVCISATLAPRIEQRCVSNIKDTFLRLMDKLKVPLNPNVVFMAIFGREPFVSLGCLYHLCIDWNARFGVRDTFSKLYLTHSATGQG